MALREVLLAIDREAMRIASLRAERRTPTVSSAAISVIDTRAPINTRTPFPPPELRELVAPEPERLHAPEPLASVERSIEWTNAGGAPPEIQDDRPAASRSRADEVARRLLSLFGMQTLKRLLFRK